MTLVEVMLAATLSIAVLAVAFAVYWTLIRALSSQSEWRAAAAPAAAALDELGRDLACAAVPFGATGEVFCLKLADAEPGAVPPPILTLHTCVPPPAGENPALYDMRIARYRLERAAGAFALVRETRRTSAPESAFETETLASGIETLAIDVGDGTAWTNEWRWNQSNGLPRAARVRMRVRSESRVRLFESEILIPAGLEFRTGSSARAERP